MRDTDLGRQFTHLRIQAAAREEVDRAVDDLLLALARFQPPPRGGRVRYGGRGRRRHEGGGPGLCGIDHLLNSAESVERLINVIHSHKP